MDRKALGFRGLFWAVVGAITRDGLWQAIGRIVDLYTPAECQNLLKNAGYAT
ncbi:Mobile element protein [Azospirillum argentinense]